MYLFPVNLQHAYLIPLVEFWKYKFEDISKINHSFFFYLTFKYWLSTWAFCYMHPTIDTCRCTHKCSGMLKDSPLFSHYPSLLWTLRKKWYIRKDFKRKKDMSIHEEPLPEKTKEQSCMITRVVQKEFIPRLSIIESKNSARILKNADSKRCYFKRICTTHYQP